MTSATPPAATSLLAMLGRFSSVMVVACLAVLFAVKLRLPATREIADHRRTG